MLLRQNFLILINLHLRQVHFSVARKNLQCSEKLGRLKTQLWFLRQCKFNGVYPKTVRNMKFPSCFEHRSLQSTKAKVKTIVLKGMIRFLYGEIARMNSYRQYLENQLLPFMEDRDNILRAMRKAFFNSKASHENILRNRLTRLLDTGNSAYRNSSYTTPDNLSAPDPSVPATEYDEDPRDNLVTDRTGTLNMNERNLLSKGPKFALAPAVNNDTVVEFNVSFCRFAHQYRWKKEQESWTNSDTDDDLIQKYPWHTRLTMPFTRDYETEAKLKRIYHRIRNSINKIPHRPKFGNLSKAEKDTLQGLRDKALVYLPSDKGSEFCVLDSAAYDSAGSDHLSDTDTYSVVPHLKPKTVEQKVNNVWRNIAQVRGVPRYITRSYCTTNSDHPRFYHLIKTHKPGNSIKIRPIVSNINGPTKKLAWLLTKLLSPLLKLVPAHLENSAELMRCIEHVTSSSVSNAGMRTFPCSFDVVALYTSIPIQDAIVNIDHKLEEFHINNLAKFTISDIHKMLQVVLTNTYFTYGEQIYRQIRGLPMGSSISGVLAILFLDTIEKQSLRTFNQIPLFRRYVDDCFALVEDEVEARLLLHDLNSRHPNIKFELELPNGRQISLLDFTVTVTTNGNARFEFYRKPAKKNIFVHADSHLPLRTKISIIRNERQRINARCSLLASQQKHEQSFDHMLQRHNYRPSVIRQSKKIQSSNTEAMDFMYLKFPYISDALDNKIKRIFRQENIPIRLTRRSYTLRNHLSKRPPPIPCQLPSCPLKNNLCNRKSTVYKWTCLTCNHFYIGSSIRPLHTRIKEHLTQATSSVFQHLNRCNGSTFTTEVLAQDKDPANLRLKEAMLIKQLRPSINSREEQDELADFLF